ncbi:hypothetical protein BaRGS_00011683 [Batillaria attramentaria]|uniref:AAA+ ATPase domain-containing protein n=1 Tax=Batillaria attramentaria TaxID=370345 RepID=A0ABD0LCJ8_9CAEN
MRKSPLQILWTGNTTAREHNTNARAEVSTLHDAVVETGRCLKNWVLSPQQVELQASKDPLVYLTGPQGTGKTVMLMLRALKWARAGRRVIFASIWRGSHAVTYSIHKQVQDRLSQDLQRKVKRLVCQKSDPDGIMEELLKAMQDDTDDTQATETPEKSTGEERLQGGHQEVEMDTDAQGSEQEIHSPAPHPGSIGKSVRQKHLSDFSPGQASAKQLRKKSVHMIFDEAPWFFPDIIEQLLDAKDQFAEFQCWAAAPFHGSKPPSFKEVQLKNTLRCPHVVIRELERGAAHSTRAIYQYSNLDAGILSSLPPLTDGPPVKRISHLEHTAHDVWHCEECGLEVGRFLNEELQIAPKWVFSKASINKTSRTKSLPRDDPSSVKELARPHPTKSEVQVADVESILGLKRTVVVVIGTHDIGATYPRYVDPWCDVISRCNSQLVVVGDMHIVNRIGNVFPKLVQIG